jgi:hypothetical protein
MARLQPLKPPGGDTIHGQPQYNSRVTINSILQDYPPSYKARGDQWTTAAAGRPTQANTYMLQTPNPSEVKRAAFPETAASPRDRRA